MEKKFDDEPTIQGSVEEISRAAVKRCLWCEQDKALSDFGRDSRRQEGLVLYCRKCIAERNAFNYAQWKGNCRDHSWKVKHDERMSQKKLAKVLEALDTHYWMGLDDVAWRLKAKTRTERETVRKFLHILVERGKAIKQSRGAPKRGHGTVWEFKRVVIVREK